MPMLEADGQVGSVDPKSFHICKHSVVHYSHEVYSYSRAKSYLPKYGGIGGARCGSAFVADVSPRHRAVQILTLSHTPQFLDIKGAERITDSTLLLVATSFRRLELLQVIKLPGLIVHSAIFLTGPFRIPRWIRLV
jgi:hypothetical protein